MAKIGLVLEEADESVFWLELIAHTHLAPIEVLRPLLQESGELVAILAATKLTLQRNLARRKSSI